MSTLKFRGVLPKAYSTALNDAQRAFASTDNSGPPFVFLRLSEIEVNLALFQPREFSYSAREFDNDHVVKLMKEIGFKGELDPILVIKLGDEWTCVDGHHRLEAYRRYFDDEKKLEQLKSFDKRFWKQKKLKCKRFTGTSVHQALDEALRLNSRQQLPLNNTDRQEAAWRHVTLDWGSLKSISETCGVSIPQVSLMRRVKNAWKDNGPVGERMRREFRKGPQSVSWLSARSLYQNWQDGEYNLEKDAQQLARTLQSRLTNKLRKNLTVSMRALQIYSPDLIEFIKKNESTAVDPEDEAEADENAFALKRAIEG